MPSLSSLKRMSRAVLSAALGTLVCTAVACNENAPPSSATTPPDQLAAAGPKLPANAPQAADPTPAAPVASGTPTAAAPTATKAPAKDDAFLPPADARWTLYCYSVQGPTHVEDANGLKAALIKKTGRRDWYLIHGRDESKLYFGYYRSIEPQDRANAAEVARARKDLETVVNIEDQNLDKPFHASAFVHLEAPDPTSPPEWDLFNVDREKSPQDPTRAYWSLQICAYRADPKRKEAAVETVRALRAQGVPAYYYHGESVSSVCVGAWPPSAVKAQNRTDELKDVAHASPDVPIVVSSEPLPENVTAKPIDGKRAVAISPKLEILDPTMAAMMKKFPNHAVNYEIGVRRASNGKEVLDPSFLVTIKRAKGDGLYDSEGAPAARVAETPGATRYEATGGAGTGGLRSSSDAIGSRERMGAGSAAPAQGFGAR